jgi:uncharacterized protein (TIGR04255 family)
VFIQKENLSIPREITPCPIIEATCELRFEPTVPADAVYGSAFIELSKIAGKGLRLPILDLPPELRETDPNLRFQPHYRFTADGYYVGLGPRAISVQLNGRYPGWGRFSRMVKSPIEALSASGVISSVGRIGLRYISFIEGDVFAKTDVEVRINDRSVSARETSVSMVIEHRFQHLIRIRKDVTVRASFDKQARYGSVVDIDTFTVNPKAGMKSFDDFLHEAHIDEKLIFFGMLKPDFLRTLNPKY